MRTKEIHANMILLKYILYIKIHVFLFSEVVEHACSITSLQLGETLPSITKDMDMYSYRFPLGVCAGIAP